MKRSLITLAATAALLAGGATAAQAATVCETINVPAVPAVYTTVTTPAVTVVEYEFTHAQDGNGQGNGQGPANKWVEDPNWNAESNPQSVGWVATGATRLHVLEVETTTVTLVAPEIPATTVEQCQLIPDGISPVPVDAPSVPLGNQDPAPVAAQEPVVAAPVVQAAPPVPVAQVAASAPEELAYTGPADWALPAGLGLLVLGGATILSRRLITTK